MTSGISIDGYMKVKDRDIKLVYPSSALLCWSCSLPHLADYQPLTVSQSTTSPTPVERASFSILTDKALRLLLNGLLATLARHSVSHGGMETRLWLIWPVMHLSRWAMGKQWFGHAECEKPVGLSSRVNQICRLPGTAFGVGKGKWQYDKVKSELHHSDIKKQENLPFVALC